MITTRRKVVKSDKHKAAKTIVQAGFQILTGPKSMFNFMSDFSGTVVLG